jgi:seryl-tRNA synthetase
MLDIKFIRENPEAVKTAAKHKSMTVNVDRLLELDVRVRELKSSIDDVRAKRNELASQSSGGKPSDEQLELGRKLKDDVAAFESELTAIEPEYLTLWKQIPNIPDADVPVGASEDDNVEISKWGTIPEFDFEPRNHMQVAELHGWIDKERATKVSGSRFAYIQGDLVRMQMALMSWIMDVVSSEEVLKTIADDAGLSVSTKPFTPILPPYLIKTESFDAMDRLEPRDDRYKIDGEELWLQGSAEHVLGSMHADEIFDAADLPVRYIGYATSFRKEAGTYGKDMEGVIRMHQFDKLEMESFVAPENGRDEHLLMVAIQEYILRGLNLPHHKLQKCTYDIGKPNARGVDMEVWFPSQQKYRETHTADYMTDYQARRLQTRYRDADGVKLIHTNDATALALGRGMAAIIENYQQADGTIRVPDVLVPYLGGRHVLGKQASE